MSYSNKKLSFFTPHSQTHHPSSPANRYITIHVHTKHIPLNAISFITGLFFSISKTDEIISTASVNYDN